MQSLLNLATININGSSKTLYYNAEELPYMIYKKETRIFSMFDDSCVEQLIENIYKYDSSHPQFKMNIRVNNTDTFTEYSIFMLACETGNSTLIHKLLPNNIKKINREYIESGCGFGTTPFEVIIGKLSIYDGCNIILLAREHDMFPTRPINLFENTPYNLI
jgi:hypothetical protein|uniref:Uncharacterized protein n=1 Tax=viral metagenome TaxID=1070528 RepID=A0A6C0IQC8_9ZZZZ